MHGDVLTQVRHQKLVNGLGLALNRPVGHREIESQHFPCAKISHKKHTSASVELHWILESRRFSISADVTLVRAHRTENKDELQSDIRDRQITTRQQSESTRKHELALEMAGLSPLLGFR